MVTGSMDGEALVTRLSAAVAPGTAECLSVSPSPQTLPSAMALQRSNEQLTKSRLVPAHISDIALTLSVVIVLPLFRHCMTVNPFGSPGSTSPQTWLPHKTRLHFSHGVIIANTDLPDLKAAFDTLRRGVGIA